SGDCKPMTDARVQAYRAALLERAIFGMYRATLEGRLLDVNPALVRMLGYESASDLLATNMRDVYADADERERLIQTHQGHDRFEGVEAMWRRKNGQPLAVRLTGPILASHD